ncbi:MAG: TetR/AcrR family transcriptional regulator [Actinomycetota bacterium]|nr:TetR/AcrR family transcriptional regulator [Actinomycetota bacterium]
MSGTFVRRTSYGPSSPVVGTRGARTRQQILDTALQRFTEHGFHGTSMEDIAAGADTSRATLYQYFESKEAIFIELMQSAGAALMRLTRRLGPLGPTEEGYDNLHWWLGEWSWVFDRYSAMFIEWANVNSPKNPLRPLLAQFNAAHNARLGTALQLGGIAPADARTWSNFINAMANRVNYIRHVYRPGPTDSEMLDSLVTALQLTLFPTTPRAIITAGPKSVDRNATPRPAAPAVHTIGPLAQVPEAEQTQSTDPFEGLSSQAARTVRRLLDAASQVFADAGYDVANVDQIVTAAGVSRGTFYRYFDDKLQVLTALAGECATEMSAPFAELAEYGEHIDPTQLRAWLRWFNELHERYGGVLRSWTEGFPVDQAVLAPSRVIITQLGASVRAMFGPKRDYTLSRRATGVMLAAMLENYPNEARGTSQQPPLHQLIEIEALFIERVLLTR